MCFLQKSHISWKLHSRRPDGKAGESSDLFLLKPFPPEGPEFKSEAFATNNWASVRGCGWHRSKASWDFEQLLMQIEGKRHPRGKCGHPEMEPLAVRRRENEVRRCMEIFLGLPRGPGLGVRRPPFSVGIWASDQGFCSSNLNLVSQ